MPKYKTVIKTESPVITEETMCVNCRYLNKSDKNDTRIWLFGKCALHNKEIYTTDLSSRPFWCRPSAKKMDGNEMWQTAWSGVKMFLFLSTIVSCSIFCVVGLFHNNPKTDAIMDLWYIPIAAIINTGAIIFLISGYITNLDTNKENEKRIDKLMKQNRVLLELCNKNKVDVGNAGL